MHFETKGTIFIKSFQILAYGIIITKSTIDIFENLAKLAEQLGLQMNETKYMLTTSQTRASHSGQSLTTDKYSFESVREFIYLNTQVEPNNNMTEEIKEELAHNSRKQVLLRPTQIFGQQMTI